MEKNDRDSSQGHFQRHCNLNPFQRPQDFQASKEFYSGALGEKYLKALGP